MSFHKVAPVRKTRKPAPAQAAAHKKHAPEKPRVERPVGRK
ncbi:hypothetical protein SAMN05428944_4290 [Streptomyces sp. 1222.5]|nr:MULTISPECIES: hypothetical protein [unclassified Streptomyces]PKW08599.1 hypothetical protein BX260_3807 [Streptomyces sp. 5112.2]SEC58798.1 hypothetical protein SAMN05428944_4290 [Streptomyces sp. 1222.5]